MSDEGGWDFVISGSMNHDFMVWKLRHDMDCITVPMIIPEFKKIFDTVDPNIENNQIAAALFLSHFIHLHEASSEKFILQDSPHLGTGLASNLKEYAENLGIDIPKKIDSKIYISITNNKLVNLGSEAKNDKLRNRLFEFSEKVKNIQHYFFHSKMITVTRLLGKLLTRMWWIYHTSSPLMRSVKYFDEMPTIDDSEEESLDFNVNSEEESSVDSQEYEDDSEDSDGEEDDSDGEEDDSDGSSKNDVSGTDLLSSGI